MFYLFDCFISVDFYKISIFKTGSKIINFISIIFYYSGLFYLSLQAYSYLNLIQIR